MLPRSAQQMCSSPLITSVTSSGLTLTGPRFPYASSPKCCSSGPHSAGLTREEGKNPLPCPAGYTSYHAWEARPVSILKLEWSNPVSLLSTGGGGLQLWQAHPQSDSKAWDPLMCPWSPLRMSSSSGHAPTLGEEQWRRLPHLG